MDDIPILKPENVDIKPDAVIISIVNKVAAKNMEDKVKKLFPDAKVYNIRDIVMGNI
ncbi:hypothetical protein [Hydrogenobaculum acidophilum]